MSTAGTADLPLELFSGRVTDIAASDLPAGASPGAQDVAFILGGVKTRPGLGTGVITGLAGNPTVNYQKTFQDNARNRRLLFLESTGLLDQEFPQGTITKGINTIPIPAGAFAKSATSYGREFIAFSDGQFGISDPAAWDGTSYRRVSQVGPGASPTAVDSAAAGNVPAGVHKVSVFFVTDQNYWTRGAPPFSWTAAGSKKVSLTNIPTGPPNIIQRVVMFTTAGGAVFFFTTGANSSLANGNMVINDNTTTTLTVDFSDTILAAGFNANYLMGLIELEASAGVVAYASRLFWWGGRNRLLNFVNLSFDGGFGGGAGVPANAGPNSPSAAVNDPSAGPPQWSNITNVFASDGLTATVALPLSAPSSAAIKATGYGFAIPANATITGILVKVLVSGGPNTTDLHVNLYKAGVLAGSDHANGNLLPQVLTYQNYGSSIDLWGTAWTPADINASNFGAAYSATNDDSNFTRNVSVDYISITVYYTTPGAATTPLGWTAGASIAGGGSALAGPFPVVFGDAFSITGDGATAVRGQITQSAALDTLSNPILAAAVGYSVRVKLASAGGLAQGTLHINLQSTSGAFTTSGLAVQANQLGATYKEFIQVLTSPLGTIPSDLLLQVYADGTPTNGGVFLVEEIEVYPTNTPFLTTTMRGSLAGQVESYDQLTGILQPFFQDGQAIRCCYVLREKLYVQKESGWYVTEDDGLNEPSSWKFSIVSTVGTSGPNCTDTGEDWSITANRNGPYLHWGGEPVKIGQEIQPDWNTINWQFGYTIWVLADKKEKRALIGAPTGAATTPNMIFYFDYRGTSSIAEMADHWSVKYSQYSGKILAIGNAPKWATWTISANSACLAERTDGTAHTFLGNGAGTGKIYDLLDANKSDDGVGIPWKYPTYFAPSHTDEQVLQIKAHRKLFAYLTGSVKGSGAMAISAQPMGNIPPTNLPNYQLVDPTATVAVSSISRVNGITTVTTAAPHGLTSGVDNVAILAATLDASFNGAFPILAIPNATQFTFAQNLPDLILGAGGTAQRIQREFEFTTNVLGERVSWTFSNAGNTAGTWMQLEKLIWSIVPDAWSPVRGGIY